MTFKTALQKLKIPEYETEIWRASPNGHIFHVMDYIRLASAFKRSDLDWFRPWFVAEVNTRKEHGENLNNFYLHMPEAVNAFSRALTEQRKNANKQKDN